MQPLPSGLIAPDRALLFSTTLYIAVLLTTCFMVSTCDQPEIFSYYFSYLHWIFGSVSLNHSSFHALEANYSNQTSNVAICIGWSTGRINGISFSEPLVSTVHKRDPRISIAGKCVESKRNEQTRETWYERIQHKTSKGILVAKIYS